MSVVITLVSPQLAGGSGGDSITTGDYTDSAAAVSAVASGFLSVANPVYGGQTTSDGKKIALSVASIRSIKSV